MVKITTLRSREEESRKLTRTPQPFYIKNKEPKHSPGVIFKVGAPFRTPFRASSAAAAAARRALPQPDLLPTCRLPCLTWPLISGQPDLCLFHADQRPKILVKVANWVCKPLGVSSDDVGNKDAIAICGIRGCRAPTLCAYPQSSPQSSYVEYTRETCRCRISRAQRPYVFPICIRTHRKLGRW
jgi:hypothetical protein